MIVILYMYGEWKGKSYVTLFIIYTSVCKNEMYYDYMIGQVPNKLLKHWNKHCDQMTPQFFICDKKLFVFSDAQTSLSCVTSKMFNLEFSEIKC